MSIQLNKIIGVHSAVKSASECLALLTPLLQKEMRFDLQLVTNLLTIKPIFLTKTSAGYEIVAGFREWELAKKHLSDSDTINVRVLLQTKRDKLLELAWSDVFGTALNSSLNPKKIALQLADVSEKIPAKFKTGIFVGVSNKQQLSKATHLSRSSFYQSSSDVESQDFSFEATFKAK